MWKYSNVCSKGVLTDRGLDLYSILLLLILFLECSLQGYEHPQLEFKITL